MKLSEAIRLGSMLKPQAIGCDRAHVEYPPVPGDVLGLRAYDASCAFIAALEACPPPREPHVVTEADEFHSLRGSAPKVGNIVMVSTYPESWRLVIDRFRLCPECAENEVATVFSLIAHLNDEHRWTREQIADWIESIEMQVGVSAPIGNAEAVDR